MRKSFKTSKITMNYIQESYSNNNQFLAFNMKKYWTHKGEEGDFMILTYFLVFFFTLRALVTFFEIWKISLT